MRASIRLGSAALVAAGCSFLAPSENELGGEYGTHSPADASVGGSAGSAVDAANTDGAADAADACPKSCNGACVTPGDPAFGCDLTSCTACAPLSNATPGCAGTTCSLGFCEDTWLNADENAANGCEAHVEYPTRGLQLHLIRSVGMPAEPGEKVQLWEDQSGNGWDAFQSVPSRAPPVLTNFAPWFSSVYGYSLELGPRTFDLSHGFTLAVAWGFSGIGTLLALDTPAGLLSIEGANGSKLRLRVGSSSSLSDGLTPQPKDMITVLQQDERGALSLLLDDHLPIAMTPDTIAPLGTSEVTNGGVGANPDQTNYGTSWVMELMFYAHAPGEPPDPDAILTYLRSK